MEAILSLAIIGSVIYGAVKAARWLWGRAAARRSQARSRRASDAAQRQRLIQQQIREQQQRKKMNWLSRKMQLSLLQLGRCPDFRRAASWAAKASAVPVGFRQRQFHRFRPQLVQHFANQLAQGADAEELLESLTELVGNLGVADFEAEYIRQEAEARAPGRRQRREPNFSQQIEQLQREHEERMTAIRNLAATDESIREQLLEAEVNRFRDELLSRSGNRADEQPLI